MRDCGYRLHVLWGRAAVQNKLQGTCMWVCKPGSNPALGLARGTVGRTWESPGNSWCQRPTTSKMQIYDCRELGFLLTLEKAGFKTQVGSLTCVSAACLICEDLWFDKLFLEDIQNKEFIRKKVRINIMHFSVFFSFFFFLPFSVCPNQWVFLLLPGNNRCVLRAKRKAD